MERRFIRRIFNLLIFTTTAFGLYSLTVAESGKNGIFIVDSTGEKWDVTQAESIGFKPGKFQYGIGRYAFTTLDDSHLQSDTSSIPKNLRVIGVAAGDEAQAYSVSKLSRHETANTILNSKPILVGY